jgi:hypothetical protein
MVHKFLLLVVVLASCSFGVLGVAQSLDPPDKGTVEAKLVDGSTVKGVVTARSASEVSIRTEFGTLRIPAAKLTAESKKRLLAAPVSSADQEAAIAKLEARIAALEAENQDLRKRLVAASQAAPRTSVTPSSGLTPSTPSSVRRITPTTEGGGLSYTISSTGKRHNSRCRYYGGGSPCGPNQGVACKICGG